MPRHDDGMRLRHMLDAAREAVASAGPRGKKAIAADHIWLLGLVKCVEIIGEAAARVSQKTRNANPQIPWAEIIAMRNRLVHAYYDIDVEQVWKAATEDLPALIAELEKACPRD
ncbi:MAG: DUF86 domain-containing protein [Deltaproteobacteria bacterium]|nr:DUF86 domain-containing protein [Deltaproteobacteria bacterium]